MRQATTSTGGTTSGGGRGLYVLREPYRKQTAWHLSSRDAIPRAPKLRRMQPAVSEQRASYSPGGRPDPRDTVHAVVSKQQAWYIGECLELALVTRARTLDELVQNLREAVALHLEGEDPAISDVVPRPRVAILYELSTAGS